MAGTVPGYPDTSCVHSTLCTILRYGPVLVTYQPGIQMAAFSLVASILIFHRAIKGIDDASRCQGAQKRCIYDGHDGVRRVQKVGPFSARGLALELPLALPF